MSRRSSRIRNLRWHGFRAIPARGREGEAPLPRTPGGALRGRGPPGPGRAGEQIPRKNCTLYDYVRLAGIAGISWCGRPGRPSGEGPILGLRRYLRVRLRTLSRWRARPRPATGLRLGAAAGVAGPVAFTAAWAAASLLQ